MAAHNPRSLGPLIAAILVGLPLLYVASFGPACWITSRASLRHNVVNDPYRPILWAFDNGPYWLQDLIREYADFGADDRWSLTRATFRGEPMTVWGQPVFGPPLILE